jgi:Domain of unknown function (DUF5615)
VSGLFVELFLDEDVPIVIAAILRARGFVALTAQETGQLGRSDADQLTYATDRRLTLLTHNRDDFIALHTEHLAAGLSHHGIIVAFRRPRPEDVVARLLMLLDEVTADEMRDQLRYI